LQRYAYITPEKQQPRRQPFSFLLLWEPQISLRFAYYSNIFLNTICQYWDIWHCFVWVIF
jgi:hypothetical protein